MTIQLIAGCDEVGRGALAGPVVAAAVILDHAHPITGLCDSKQLSLKQRERLFIQITSKAAAYSIAQAEVEEIDQLNILHASLLAMRRAVMGLAATPDHVIVDGNHTPSLPYPCQAVIKGDQLIEAISAASILAKVNRDHQMQVLDKQYPDYDFARHKGYGTRIHLIALNRFGASPIHRQTFAPVRRAMDTL